MNGFLLHISYNSLEFNFDSNLLPSEVLPELKHNEVFPGVDLFTWGETQGDIYVSYQSGKSILVMNGYITDAPGIESFSSQQLICNSFREYFDFNINNNFIDYISKLNGSFSLVYFNFNDYSLHTFSDRLATRQLFWKKDKKEIYFSSNAILIAKLSSSFDYSPSSIGSYFLYGTLIDPNKSIFSSIFCQKEGTYKFINANNILSDIIWYKFNHFPDDNRTLKDWLFLTSERITHSAERILRITSNPLIFLSGGVDSRITTAALIAAGGNPFLCTISDSPNLEVKIAKLVANNFKCRHHIIYRDDEWYLRTLNKSVFISNGIYDWTHSHFSQAYSILSGQYSINGALLGDFFEAFSKLCCSKSLKFIDADSIDNFFEKFDHCPLPNYRPICRIRTLKLFNSNYRSELENQLKQDIINRYNTIASVSKDPLIVADYFFRWQTATCMPTYQMFNDIRSAGPERNIMFDKDLYSILEIMPSYIRDKSNFGSRIINFFSAKASLLPNSNSLLPLISPLFLHSFAKSTKPLLGKFRRKFFTNTHHTTGSWSHLPLLYYQNNSWKKLIEQRFFDSTLFPSHMFDHSRIYDCWQEFCAGDLSLFSDIERLLGFSFLYHYK